MTKEMLHQLVEETCLRMFGCELREATEKQAYRALCVTVRMMLEDRQRAFQAETREKERKQVYYMSMEFLVGTSLRNNLFNLGLYNEADEVLTELASRCRSSARWSRTRGSETAVWGGLPRATWMRRPDFAIR